MWTSLKISDSFTGMKERIHKKICESKDTLKDWYSSQTSGVYLPFYSSYDIRDAGFKIGVVDGNIYPAGFNNICPVSYTHLTLPTKA